MAMRGIFWGFCRNRFLMSPSHYLSSRSDFGFVFAESGSRCLIKILGEKKNIFRSLWACCCRYPLFQLCWRSVVGIPVFALSMLLATPLLAGTVAGVSTVACILAVPGILLLLVFLLFLVFLLLLASLLFLMSLMLLQRWCLIEIDEMLSLKHYIKGKMIAIMRSATRRVGESLSEKLSKNSPTRRVGESGV